MSVGDIVEATEGLDTKLKGMQGCVVGVTKPNLVHVRMEKKLLESSEQAEILMSAGFLWKIVVKDIGYEA